MMGPQTISTIPSHCQIQERSRELGRLTCPGIRYGVQPKEHSRQEKVAEEIVDYFVSTATPKALNLNDNEAATESDPILQAVSEAICKSNCKPARNPASTSRSTR